MSLWSVGPFGRSVGRSVVAPLLELYIGYSVLYLDNIACNCVGNSQANTFNIIIPVLKVTRSGHFKIDLSEIGYLYVRAYIHHSVALAVSCSVSPERLPTAVNTEF